MTYRALFILLFVVYTSTVVAQKYSMDSFHPGMVYVYGGDSVQGSIKYDFNAEQVQVQTYDRLLAFNSAKIDRVQFSDVLTGYNRELRIYEYSISNNGYDLPVLFEFLLDGSKIQVLARENIVWETNTNFISPYTMPITTSQRRLVIQLYFRSAISGKIKRYTYSKGDLMLYVRSKSSQVKAFMKREKLKANRNDDVVRIIEYFNNLR